MRRALLLLLLLVLPASVSAQTSVIVRGKISTANATVTPLSGGATYTGGWESARDYTTLTVVVFSDKASAAGGFTVQWSSDAVTVDVTDTYSVSASVGATWTTVSKDAYFRCVYVNGAVTQTVFRLSAIQRQSGAPGYAENNLTDTQLRATPVPVSGTVTATPTGTQAVSGTVTANAGTGTLAVSGPVTDAQLRATPVPVSGTVTANVGTGTQPVSGTVTVTDGSGALNVIVDSGTTAATQSGTWTVQPGNTANTVAWKVDGSAVTQPVSGTVTANVGTGTQPVSGTFWQATQPVSGTFWQATQPVSGTFWQATQPVSGPLTDTQLRLTPVPVSGTVTANAGTNLNTSALALDATLTGGTQKTKLVDTGGTNVASVSAGGALKVDNSGVTQPVSGTITANAGTGTLAVSGPVTDAQIRATPLPVSGTVTVTDGSGAMNVIVDSGTTAATQSGTWTVQPGNTANTTAWKVDGSAVTQPVSGTVALSQTTTANDVDVATIAAGNNNIGDVDVASIVPPTLTKGTQGATGFSIQELKDAGRTAISFYANNVAAGTTTTETLITLTQSKGTGATSSAASYTVTSGKILRLTAIQVAARGHATATIQSTVFNLRLNTAGACIVSSTPILMGVQAATAAVASAWDRVTIPIPDGYEIAGNGTVAICISAAATYTTNAPTWSVNLIGYEY